MKTREEIEQEYSNRLQQANKDYDNATMAAEAWRDAALAELDDPMTRLIAAGKGWLEQHGDCSYEPCNELRDAINYAEQRRVQG